MIPYHRAFSPTDPSVCTFSFDRGRVVRRDAGPRWVGAVHEVIIVPGPTIGWPDAWVEHRPRPDDREHKVDRNLRILEQAVLGGDRSSRTLFYIGNELRDHGRWEEALLAYQEYLDTPEFLVWERHSALLSMAACAEGLHRESDKLVFLHDAIRLDSTRAEPFVKLGVHHYERQEWRQAVPYLAAASALRRPTRTGSSTTRPTAGPHGTTSPSVTVSWACTRRRSRRRSRLCALQPTASDCSPTWSSISTSSFDGCKGGRGDVVPGSFVVAPQTDSGATG